MQYSIFLLLVWMSELIVGMLGYVYYEEVRDDLKSNLRSAFQYQYFSDDHQDVTNIVDYLHRKVRLLPIYYLWTKMQ